MRKRWLSVVGCVALVVVAARGAEGQARPYIGFAYPAGGQRGTTFEVRLGGQNLEEPELVLVSGTGVSARVVEYRRRYGPQEMQLLNEQLRALRPAARAGAAKPGAAMPGAAAKVDEATQQLIARIERRRAEYVNRPACAAISNLVIVEVTIAPDATPGRRELIVATTRGGVSNPLPFHVGQFPEVARKPMATAAAQVLGKERLSLRKRPDDEVESRVTLPCTLNGQIASGEVNRYRFEARKGQRLVIAAAARQLNPFVADAVPGWFQPVLALHDADGREVAYNDDFRFKPDPVILFEVPKDGQYVLTVSDAIYRGREDFVYRVTIGEVPFVTSIFPLGGRAGEASRVQVTGWNLAAGTLAAPGPDARPGVYELVATGGRGSRGGGWASNAVPFELGTLPEAVEKEPNDVPSEAQAVTLPVVMNGRIGRGDDVDVYRIAGRAGQTIVADVDARRLDSPLDSCLKVTDAAGNVLAFNDDQEDPEAGTNTHDADSYVRVRLPADGTYYVHVGDTTRAGSEAHGYRLRLSEPRPDFALRVVPSSASVRTRGSTAVTVRVIRKDGFAGPVQVSLDAPPAGRPGLTASPLTIAASQEQGRLTLRADRVAWERPTPVVIRGTAKIEGRTVSNVAVAAEDRMQAFLWRHLVPAEALHVLVFDPARMVPPKRPLPATRPATPAAPAAGGPSTAPAGTPKFTQRQVASRLRQLKLLYEDGLLTDEFYLEKVAECEAAAP